MGLLQVPNIVVNGTGGSRKGDATKPDGTKDNVRDGEVESYASAIIHDIAIKSLNLN